MFINPCVTFNPELVKEECFLLFLYTINNLDLVVKISKDHNSARIKEDEIWLVTVVDLFLKGFVGVKLSDWSPGRDTFNVRLCGIFFYSVFTYSKK